MKYGKMMKGIGVAALALTVVSSCMVGGTLAKYTTTATGTGSAIVAKWAPSFKDAEGGTYTNDTVVKLTDTTVDPKTVTDGRIAPGTAGSYSVKVGRGDSEVGFSYTITISDVNDKPANLDFYDEAGTTKLTAVDGVYTLTPNDNTVAADATEEKTITVNWKWPYQADGADPTANDAADNTAGAAGGENGTKMTFKVNITATQVEPTQKTV